MLQMKKQFADSFEELNELEDNCGDSAADCHCRRTWIFQCSVDRKI